MVKVEFLQPPFPQRISIVENPLPARQVGTVTIVAHGPCTDDFHCAVAIPVQIKFFLSGRMPGPGQNVLGIPPDKMGGTAIIVHHAHIGAIGSGAHHAGVKAALGKTPAMQKDKTRTIRTEKEVIEIVPGGTDIAVGIGNLGDLRHADNQPGLTSVQVQLEDAGIFRRQRFAVGVLDTGVSVSGTHVLNAAKICANCDPTVWTEAIDRLRQGALMAACHIQNMADKAIRFPIVPQNLAARTRAPL